MSRASWIFLAAFGAFTLYVVHSGGDFMYARRLMPAMPFLFLVVEDLSRAIAHPKARLAVLAFAVVGALFPYSVYGGDVQRISGIANEPMYYERPSLEARRAHLERDLARSARRRLRGDGSRRGRTFRDHQLLTGFALTPSPNPP